MLWVHFSWQRIRLPVLLTSMGQIIYGAAIGILAGVFRCIRKLRQTLSAMQLSWATCLTPLIEEVTVPVPYGNRKQKEEGAAKKCPIPMPALILLAITVIAGVCLSGVHEMTADIIAEQQAGSKTCFLSGSMSGSN